MVEKIRNNTLLHETIVYYSNFSVHKWKFFACFFFASVCNVYVCVWRFACMCMYMDVETWSSIEELKQKKKQMPSSITFHLVHWGRVSWLSPKLTNMLSLTRQFVLGDPLPSPSECWHCGRLPPAFCISLALHNTSPHICVESAVPTESAPHSL